MNKTLLMAAMAMAYPIAVAASEARDPAEAQVKKLGMVVLQGSRSSSLPTNIPTTTESITAADIDRLVNATDSEDALKYFPSLLVRKRYIGDYNHAILSSRASGTGNSARSAVYADGILLSNFLGNGVGGLSFPPRWNLVTPEEIERVDVMYGPFSAAYPGNSVGAVVDFITRMPSQFEAHLKTTYVLQPFKLYSTDEHEHAWQTSASVGSRAGDLSWWINLNHTESLGQPLTFATRLKSVGTAGSAGTAVTGAVANANNANQPWSVLGTGTQYDTRQDHVKIKLAYDLTAGVRASYLLGVWQNDSDGNSKSYLKDASGNAVYSGPINFGGLQYTGSQALAGGDFAVTREDLMHVMQGLSVLSHTGGVFDWGASFSAYDYRKDDKRQNAASNPQPTALNGGPGTIADGHGTGWTTLSLRGTWRPNAEHVIELGAQQERYKLRYRTSSITGDYLVDGPGTLANSVRGETRLQSIYAQDAWSLAQNWQAVLGLRAEHWTASDGRTEFSTTSSRAYPSRSVNDLSPKAALSWQWLPQTVLKASVGRALRMPTVSELYGATSTTNSQYINDPNLKPEKSWTGELSAESHSGPVSSRLTFFAEDTRDSLYSQMALDSTANKNISRVQNVHHIATTGLEATLSSFDWLLPGLELSASVTYADSKIKSNAGFVVSAGDTLDKWQPNIPRWRATAVASYRVDGRWTVALAGRYSGRQYRTLNNADVNGFTYQGVSKYATLDARVLYRFNRQWSAAFGIDNLNNYQFWNFHPYPQRSYTAELKFDLWRRVTMRFTSLTLMLLLALATNAQAHVTLPPGGATAGSVYAAAFRVGHACSKQAAATTGLRVRLPAGFKVIEAQPREGWTLSSSPGEVIWTAGSAQAAVPNAQKTAFVIKGKLTGKPGTLYFKVLQTCDKGSSDWAEIPAREGDRPKMPAARLDVLPPGVAAVDVRDAWARLAVPGQTATGVFARLNAPSGARLVGGSSPVASRVEVHEMKMDGDIMRMRQLESGLELPTGQAVELRPGGPHLMLQGLRHALPVGGKVPLELHFVDLQGRKGTLKLDVPVVATPPEAGSAQHHH